MRLLSRVGESDVLATAVRGDSSFYLLEDGSFWAYEHDGFLWAAGTRSVIARRDSSVFFDVAGDLALFEVR